jgi:hypothetical protein
MTGSRIHLGKVVRFGRVMASGAGAVAALGFVIALAACGGEGARVDEPTVLVQDSAGVRVILNSDPRAVRSGAGVEAWTVDPSPVLDIDGGEAGFGLISDVVVLGDGTIMVGDAHLRHIRLFAPDGAARTVVGRQGQGPGEFEAIDALISVGGDTAAVWDSRLARYTLVSAEGGLGRQVRLEPTGERARATPLGILPDGAILAADDPRLMPEDERYRADIGLVVYDAAGAFVREVTRVPGVEMWNWVWEMGVTPSTVPFGRPTVYAADGDHVWVGTNDGYRIDRLSTGGDLIASARVDRAARPLRPTVIEGYKAAERAKASSGAAAKGGNDIFGMMAEDAPYPDVLPHYDALQVDGVGRLWVRDYVVDPEAPTRYVVFAPDGRVVATAELPARFRVEHIADDRVLGVWRDDFDVERVRAYRLSR